MAVRRVQEKKNQSLRAKLRSAKPQGKNKLELEFPSKPNIPSGKLSETVIMLYGEKKIGKTSLASQFSKNMLHLMLEPQARELETYQVSCPDYEHFNGWVEKLVTEKHKFDSVSVDTLPLLYMLSMEYTGRVHGFEHPHDERDFGKSWGLVYKDFSEPLMKLLHSKMGLVFHAHETEDEIETREGRTYTIRRPDGMKGVKTFTDEKVENIWYYHKRGSKRFLQIRGDDFAFACCSFTNKFFTPSGEQIFAVPMGNSAEEGFKNLLKAFNNKQTETYNELEEKEVVKKEKVRVAKRKR